MRDLTEEAFAVIDAANASDPNQVPWRGEPTPLALLQGRLASEWIDHLVPGAGPALRIAARAHHLRRWAVPRHTYPEGRAGYLRWRRDQKRRHAAELLELLEPLGLPAGVAERAADLVVRGDLSDPDARAVEDAACLVFLQLQLDATAEQIADEDHVVEILRKSARKMSPAGLAAAATIELSPAGRSLLERALAGL